MIEKIIVLEDVDPVIFYGVNNSNIQIIKALYPKLRIVARGNVLKVLGDEEEMCSFEENIVAIEKYCATYNQLTEDNVVDIIKGRRPGAEYGDSVILFNINGKPIVPRNDSQKKLVSAYEKNDMLFSIGPAGTGKTYLSIALAVRALKSKTAKRIILSRPAVEAGEKLGFLPGDMKDKIDPYLQPLYDALQDMIGRGAEHHTATDKDVYDKDGQQCQIHHQRRHNAGGSAAIAEVGSHTGAGHTERRERHRLRGV